MCLSLPCTSWQYVGLQQRMFWPHSFGSPITFTGHGSFGLVIGVVPYEYSDATASIVGMQFAPLSENGSQMILDATAKGKYFGFIIVSLSHGYRTILCTKSSAEDAQVTPHGRCALCTGGGFAPRHVKPPRVSAPAHFQR